MSNSGEGGGGSLKAITDLVKAAFWPILVAVIFFDFHDVMKRTFDLIPAAVQNASKLQIGSLSLEIRAQATASGNRELAQTLGELDGDEIALLLQVPQGSTGIFTHMDQEGNPKLGVPDISRLNTLQSLVSKDLVYSSVPVQTLIDSINNLHPKPRADAQNEVFWVEVVERSSDSDGAAFDLLSDATYRLTEKGVRGVQAIVAAISKELKPG